MSSLNPIGKWAACSCFLNDLADANRWLEELCVGSGLSSQVLIGRQRCVAVAHAAMEQLGACVSFGGSEFLTIVAAIGAGETGHSSRSFDR